MSSCKCWSQPPGMAADKCITTPPGWDANPLQGYLIHCRVTPTSFSPVPNFPSNNTTTTRPVLAKNEVYFWNRKNENRSLVLEKNLTCPPPHPIKYKNWEGGWERKPRR